LERVNRALGGLAGRLTALLDGLEKTGDLDESLLAGLPAGLAGDFRDAWAAWRAGAGTEARGSWPEIFNISLLFSRFLANAGESGS
jgi:hypothetical protein